MAKPEEFEFEDWKSLAESDPEAFEAKRQHLLGMIIAAAPDHYRRRLQRLQWRIDAERQRSSNPLSACMRISGMMMNAVYGKDGLVDALNGRVERDDRAAAKVIDLEERRSQRTHISCD
ncbi:MAG: DUF3135 domain-containing protein [Gammaproteobacteria bacterium]|nr:DUF3135 domain-containing protein [Gammaproteobacteria bacterium]